MRKTVELIRQQIAKLQQQERALLDKEIAGVVARIREAVAHCPLTPEQIFGPLSKTIATPPVSQLSKAKKVERAERAGAAKPVAPRSKPATVSKGTKIAAKFEDKAGNSWSGRGSQPRWLRAALEAGASLEDFAVAEG